MESNAHLILKAASISLALRAGCAAATGEVRCPIARHRVDVAGYLDPLPKNRGVLEEWETAGRGSGSDLKLERGDRAKSIIIECKQSRSDFLSDSRDTDELLSERDRLNRVRAVLEEQIVKVSEPQLRRSGSRLFAELEEWDFGKSRIASYRGVLNDLRRIEERLYGERKFWTMAHYRLADWLYLAAPAGIIRPREVPPGWGLLEMAPGWERSGGGGSGLADLRVRVVAPEHSGKPEHRQRLLRNIAVAASRRAAEMAPILTRPG